MEWLLSKILRKIGISSQQFKVLTFGSWWVRTWFFLRIPWWITGPLHFLHLCPLVQYVQQGAGVDRIQQEWCNWIKSPPVAHCSTLPEGSTFWSSTKKGSVFSRSIWSKSTLPRPPSWRLPCSATTRRSPQQRSFWCPHYCLGPMLQANKIRNKNSAKTSLGKCLHYCPGSTIEANKSMSCFNYLL